MTTQPIDMHSTLRSKSYRALLIVAAAVGVIVSLFSWAFLVLVEALQNFAFESLPKALGFVAAPWWWPLPVLFIAGCLVAYAVVRLPGHGGHVPWKGLQAGGPPTSAELPGILLAALATLGLGLVLGPEAPLLALGAGLAVLTLRLAKKDAPDQALMVVGAAGSFAALSAVFGSPLVGSVIIIEAIGLGGPALTLVLLPGLLAAGIGSLVFIGMGAFTGLSTSMYALAPLTLPPFAQPAAGDLLWSMVMAVVAAGVTFLLVSLGKHSAGITARKPLVVIPAWALVVAGLAIAYAQLSGQPADAVLFSGQDAMSTLVSEAGSLPLSALALLILLKGLAWGLSMGSFRGGPTFPAIFLGLAGGILMSRLTGFPETAAIAVAVGAMTVSLLKLPLSSVMLALLITGTGALASTPMVILAVVVAYLTTQALAATGTRSSQDA